MREHIVKENVYIPETGINYPDQPDAHILEKKKLRDVIVDKNYPFIDKSFKGRLLNWSVYLGIFTIMFIVHPIMYGLKIKGRKNLRKNRKLFKNGAITISNHVYRWDFLAVVQAVKYRRLWFPAWKDNLEGSDMNFIRGAGGIPVPESISAIRTFNQAFDELHAKKKWIHVFPEAANWHFYQPIRPFKKGAFTMAQRYDLPVIPCAISYRKPGKIATFFGRKNPFITLTIGEPLLIDKELSPKEAVNKLRLETHQQIVSMAGIVQNCWQAEGD